MQEVNLAGKKKPVGGLTKLLMRLDGSTVDECGNTVGNVVGVTYVSGMGFGKKAATFAKTGAISMAVSPNLVIAGDFTVEFLGTYNLPNTTSENIAITGQAGQFVDFLVNQPSFNGGKPCWLISMSVNNDQSNRLTIDAPWMNNGLHHFAITRKGNVVNIWLDGVKSGTMAMTVPWGSINSNTTIGNFNSWVYGYGAAMQEMRISNTCRYTDTFTPPNAPFVLD